MSYRQGLLAEQIAARFLVSRGVQVVTSNYRCKRGEIDLITLDEKTLCFVEVRFRRSGVFGKPIESISKLKQQRIVAAAEHFLTFCWPTRRCACRFDAVTLEGTGASEIRWWRSVFETEAGS
jgi:putative endonuclease